MRLSCLRAFPLVRLSVRPSVALTVLSDHPQGVSASLSSPAARAQGSGLTELLRAGVRVVVGNEEGLDEILCVGVLFLFFFLRISGLIIQY